MTYFIYTWTNFGNFGGIQVLINNLADHECKLGNSFRLVGIQGNPNEFKYRSAYLNYFDKQFESDLLSDINERKSNDHIIILSFNGASLAISVLIQSILRRRGIASEIIVGVYHPRTFLFDIQRPLSSLLSILLIRRLSAESVYFMNYECRRRHTEGLGRQFGRSRVIPLPVNDLGQSWKGSRVSGHIEVCSVGRISKLKGYNFASATIARSLFQKGVDLSWEIFGAGEDEDRLIKHLEGQDLVHFRGPIPNERFREIAKTADLFVGMGTAAIQASQLGIPCVIAIEDSETESYGFSFEAPKWNVGEREEGQPLKKISDVIEVYSQQSTEERQQTSRKCREWSKQFSSQEFYKSIFVLLRKSQNKKRSRRLTHLALIYSWGLSTKSRGRRLGKKFMNILSLSQKST